jgi:hypothetical protein
MQKENVHYLKVKVLFPFLFFLKIFTFKKKLLKSLFFSFLKIKNMGQSKSKTVSTAIAKIGISVTQNILVSQTTLNQLNQTFRLHDCYIKGVVNIKSVSDIIGSNRQLVSSIQNTTIDNKIAQSVNALALSTVKPFNFSHIQASQFVSKFASKTNEIKKIITDIATNAAYLDNNFSCDRQYVVGDINIGFNNRIDFWNDQVESYDQTTALSTEILQDIVVESKAKATGIGIFIIIIIAGIILVYLSVKFSKKNEENEKKFLKTTLTLLACILLLSLPVILYYTKIPPFFSTPKKCCPYPNLFVENDFCEKCIDETVSSFNIDNPPMRYLNNIFYDNIGDPDLPYGLLNMAGDLAASIDSLDYTYNQGYNANVWWTNGSDDNRNLWKFSVGKGQPFLPNLFKVDKICGNKAYCKIPAEYINIDLGDGYTSESPNIYEPTNTKFQPTDSVPSLPSGSTDSEKERRRNIMCTLNVEGWKSFIGNDKTKALHARFMLCYYLGYDTTVYIDENERVTTPSGGVGFAKDNKKTCYKFDNFVFNESFDKRIKSGGKVTGNLGTCVNNSYKVDKFFSKIGNYILVFILILIIFFIIKFFLFQKKKKD